MKKKWGAFIYVPVLACLVAVGGAAIWKRNVGQTEMTPNQVYYLDEYFEAEANHSSEARVVDEKDVVLENKPVIVEEFDAEEPDAHAEFILQLVDDHVIVYRCEDMSESYMSTGIRAEDLPEATLQEIIQGKEILDEESLYFFLESYSS